MDMQSDHEWFPRTAAIDEKFSVHLLTETGNTRKEKRAFKNVFFQEETEHSLILLC